jgi:hypothetical protein
MLWKLAFSIGLYQVSEHVLPLALEQRTRKDTLSFRATLTTACSRMSHLWQQSTRVVWGGVILHLCRLFGVSYTPPSTFASALILGFAFLTPMYSSKQSATTDLKQAGMWISDSLQYCSWAILAQAILTIPLSLLLDKSMDTRAKLFLATGLHTPFVTASLLWKMRVSLGVVLARVETSSGESSKVEQPFWEAHTKFYNQLQSVLFWEIVFKALAVVSNLIWPAAS